MSKVKCNASDRCPNIFCPHAVPEGHEPFGILYKPFGVLYEDGGVVMCTDESSCTWLAANVKGVGAVGAVCRCEEIEKGE